MSIVNFFPTLDDAGWENSSVQVADKLLSHFFVSEYSQTNEFRDYISSLPYIIQSNQGNIQATALDVQTTLQTYFSKYFNSVVVESSEVPNTLDPNKGQISIYISFTDDQNNQYSVGKMVKFNKTKIEEIVTISNG